MRKYLAFLIFLTGCMLKTEKVIEKEISNPFQNRKDSVFSLSGDIDYEETAISPNGKFYVKVLEPYNTGKIGIFLKNGERISEINTLKENEENDIKVITWHPDNFVIGVIYHKNGISEISFYEIFTRKLLRKISLSGYYHYMVFDLNGKNILLSEDGQRIGKINLRNTDFAYNSGINLPWINYGWDIGRNPWDEKNHGGFSSNKNQLYEKFKKFKEIGIEIVRVFLFCDLRSGVMFNEKEDYKFDEYVYNDFQALIEVAKNTDIKLLPVIFDYTIADGVKQENGIPVGEHPEIFENISVQRKILKLYEDFFKKIKTNGTIYGWDIINEPEHIEIEKEKIDNFIYAFIKIIKKYRKNEKVTVGCLSGKYISNYTKFNLDFYQFHHYDSFEHISPLNYHFYNLFLDKPVIIGEIESTDLVEKMTGIWENGYKGVLIWPDENFMEKDWIYYKAWMDVH